MNSGQQQNYFEIFGLAPAYELELKALEAAYEKLSLEHHPDFFAAAEESRKKEAIRISAALNEGFRVLSSEPLRAAHLLALWGDCQPLDTTHLPPGFLQEMFLLQEELDELEATAEAGRATTLKQEVEAQLAETRRERATLFARATQGALTIETLQLIQTNLNREKYLQRLMDRL